MSSFTADQIISSKSEFVCPLYLPLNGFAASWRIISIVPRIFKVKQRCVVVILITRRLLRNDFIAVVHRKPRDNYIRLYALSLKGPQMWAEGNGQLRRCGVKKFSASTLRQFTPQKAELTPLLVAERTEPHTTMEGKQSRTDYAGLLSQFTRLEVKVRCVVLAGESPAADCANGSSLHFFTDRSRKLKPTWTRSGGVLTTLTSVLLTTTAK